MEKLENKYADVTTQILKWRSERPEEWSWMFDKDGEMDDYSQFIRVVEELKDRKLYSLLFPLITLWKNEYDLYDSILKTILEMTAEAGDTKLYKEFFDRLIDNLNWYNCKCDQAAARD